MTAGPALLVFALSFLPVLILQRRLAASVAGLLLTSLGQIGMTAVAVWGMLRYAGWMAVDPHAAQGAHATGMMTVMAALPGLGVAVVLNGLVAVGMLGRIWWEARK